MAWRFHASLAGYAPTPLRDLTALTSELGVAELRLKDESSRLGLSANKYLGASSTSVLPPIDVGRLPAHSERDASHEGNSSPEARFYPV